MLLDTAVFLPELCYIHYAPVGSIAPTADTIDAYDPETDPDVLGDVINEVQTVNLTGAPTGGTFTLTFSGQTTSSLAHSATATQVRTALEALSNIAPGDVSVTTANGGIAPWTVTFGGQYAGVDVPTMTATSSLTGGTSPGVNVVVTAEGGPAGGYEAWRHFGHSDLDEDIDSDQEGGDTDVRGTRQRPNLRTRDEPTSDYFVISGVQFSPGQLKLYHGGGTEAPGSFTVPTTRKAVEYAVLLIFVDGDRKIGEYHPRCSVKAGGAISREAENFLRMPIRFTPLSAPGNGPDTVFLSSDLFDGDGEDD